MTDRLMYTPELSGRKVSYIFLLSPSLQDPKASLDRLVLTREDEKVVDIDLASLRTEAEVLQEAADLFVQVACTSPDSKTWLSPLMRRMARDCRHAHSLAREAGRLPSYALGYEALAEGCRYYMQSHAGVPVDCDVSSCNVRELVMMTEAFKDLLLRTDYALERYANEHPRTAIPRVAKE